MKIKELREMLDELESIYQNNPERFSDVEFDDVEIEIEFTHETLENKYTGYYEISRFNGCPVALFLKEGKVFIDCYD